eukprot:g1287.t1
MADAGKKHEDTKGVNDWSSDEEDDEEVRKEAALRAELEKVAKKNAEKRAAKRRKLGEAEGGAAMDAAPADAGEEAKKAVAASASLLNKNDLKQEVEPGADGHGRDGDEAGAKLKMSFSASNTKKNVLPVPEEEDGARGNSNMLKRDHHKKDDVHREDVDGDEKLTTEQSHVAGIKRKSSSLATDSKDKRKPPSSKEPGSKPTAEVEEPNKKQQLLQQGKEKDDDDGVLIVDESSSDDDDPIIKKNTAMENDATRAAKKRKIVSPEAGAEKDSKSKKLAVAGASSKASGGPPPQTAEKKSKEGRAPSGAGDAFIGPANRPPGGSGRDPKSCEATDSASATGSADSASGTAVAEISKKVGPQVRFRVFALQHAWKLTDEVGKAALMCEVERRHGGVVKLAMREVRRVGPFSGGEVWIEFESRQKKDLYNDLLGFVPDDLGTYRSEIVYRYARILENGNIEREVVTETRNGSTLPAQTCAWRIFGNDNAWLLQNVSSLLEEEIATWAEPTLSSCTFAIGIVGMGDTYRDMISHHKNRKFSTFLRKLMRQLDVEFLTKHNDEFFKDRIKTDVENKPTDHDGGAAALAADAVAQETPAVTRHKKGIWCSELVRQFSPGPKVHLCKLFEWLRSVLLYVERGRFPDEYMFALSFLHILVACAQRMREIKKDALEAAGEAEGAAVSKMPDVPVCEVVRTLNKLAVERTRDSWSWKANPRTRRLDLWFGFGAPFFHLATGQTYAYMQHADCVDWSATSKLFPFDPFHVRIFLFFTCWSNFFAAAHANNLPVWIVFDCMVMKFRHFRSKQAHNWILDQGDTPDACVIFSKAAEYTRILMRDPHAKLNAEEGSASETAKSKASGAEDSDLSSAAAAAKKGANDRCEDGAAAPATSSSAASPDALIDRQYLVEQCATLVDYAHSFLDKDENPQIFADFTKIFFESDETASRMVTTLADFAVAVTNLVDSGGGDREDDPGSAAIKIPASLQLGSLIVRLLNRATVSKHSRNSVVRDPVDIAFWSHVFETVQNLPGLPDAEAASSATLLPERVERVMQTRLKNMQGKNMIEAYLRQDWDSASRAEKKNGDGTIARLKEIWTARLVDKLTQLVEKDPAGLQEIFLGDGSSAKKFSQQKQPAPPKDSAGSNSSGGGFFGSAISSIFSAIGLGGGKNATSAAEQMGKVVSDIVLKMLPLDAEKFNEEEDSEVRRVVEAAISCPMLEAFLQMRRHLPDDTDGFKVLAQVTTAVARCHEDAKDGRLSLDMLTYLEKIKTRFAAVHWLCTTRTKGNFSAVVEKDDKNVAIEGRRASKPEEQEVRVEVELEGGQELLVVDDAGRAGRDDDEDPMDVDAPATPAEKKGGGDLDKSSLDEKGEGAASNAPLWSEDSDLAKAARGADACSSPVRRSHESEFDTRLQHWRGMVNGFHDEIKTLQAALALPNSGTSQTFGEEGEEAARAAWQELLARAYVLSDAAQTPRLCDFFDTLEQQNSRTATVQQAKDLVQEFVETFENGSVTLHYVSKMSFPPPEVLMGEVERIMNAGITTCSADEGGPSAPSAAPAANADDDLQIFDSNQTQLEAPLDVFDDGEGTTSKKSSSKQTALRIFRRRKKQIQTFLDTQNVQANSISELISFVQYMFPSSTASTGSSVAGAVASSSSSSSSGNPANSDFAATDARLQFFKQLQRREPGFLKSTTLGDVSDAVNAWYTILREIKEEHVRLMRAIRNASEVFTWWRNNIKNAQEFKNFVDLAHIDAGESDIEVDRISTLDLLGQCVGPLVYAKLEDVLVAEAGAGEAMQEVDVGVDVHDNWQDGDFVAEGGNKKNGDVGSSGAALKGMVRKDNDKKKPAAGQKEKKVKAARGTNARGTQESGAATPKTGPRAGEGAPAAPAAGRSNIDPYKLQNLFHRAFHELRKDPTGLLAKIDDLFRNRSWLYNIQASHGSVEASAVKRAEQLTKHAVFVLGCDRTLQAICFREGELQRVLGGNVDRIKIALMPDGERTAYLGAFSVGGGGANNNAVGAPPPAAALAQQEEQGDGPGGIVSNEYSLLQLKDLNDKLMLISTERKTADIDRFCAIFKHLVELNEVLQQVAEKKLPLFSRLVVAIDPCANELRISLQLYGHEIRLRHEQTAEAGTTSSALSSAASTVRQDSEFDLSACLGFLTSALTDKVVARARDSVERVRRDFPILNCYTNVQLVNLQKLLALVHLVSALTDAEIVDFGMAVPNEAELEKLLLPFKVAALFGDAEGDVGTGAGAAQATAGLIELSDSESGSDELSAPAARRQSGPPAWKANAFRCFIAAQHQIWKRDVAYLTGTVHNKNEKKFSLLSNDVAGAEQQPSSSLDGAGAAPPGPHVEKILQDHVAQALMLATRGPQANAQDVENCVGVDEKNDEERKFVAELAACGWSENVVEDLWMSKEQERHTCATLFQRGTDAWTSFSKHLAAKAGRRLPVPRFHFKSLQLSGGANSSMGANISSLFASLADAFEETWREEKVLFVGGAVNQIAFSSEMQGGVHLRLLGELLTKRDELLLESQGGILLQSSSKRFLAAAATTAGGGKAAKAGSVVTKMTLPSAETLSYLRSFEPAAAALAASASSAPGVTARAPSTSTAVSVNKKKLNLKQNASTVVVAENEAGAHQELEFCSDNALPTVVPHVHGVSSLLTVRQLDYVLSIAKCVGELPSREDVLFCSADTTVEEVRLFIKRALCRPRGALEKARRHFGTRDGTGFGPPGTAGALARAAASRKDSRKGTAASASVNQGGSAAGASSSSGGAATGLLVGLSWAGVAENKKKRAKREAERLLPEDDEKDEAARCDAGAGAGAGTDGTAPGACGAELERERDAVQATKYFFLVGVEKLQYHVAVEAYAIYVEETRIREREDFCLPATLDEDEGALAEDNATRSRFRNKSDYSAGVFNTDDQDGAAEGGDSTESSARNRAGAGEVESGHALASSSTTARQAPSTTTFSTQSRLLLFCAEEAARKSHLFSAFAEQKISTPELLPAWKMRNFLRPTAQFFKLVTSADAGGGKTWFIEHEIRSLQEVRRQQIKKWNANYRARLGSSSSAIMKAPSQLKKIKVVLFREEIDEDALCRRLIEESSGSSGSSGDNLLQDAAFVERDRATSNVSQCASSGTGRSSGIGTDNNPPGGGGPPSCSVDGVSLAIHLVLPAGVVFRNLSDILFKLVVLRVLETRDGSVWRVGPEDFCFVETSNRLVLDFDRVRREVRGENEDSGSCGLRYVERVDEEENDEEEEETDFAQVKKVLVDERFDKPSLAIAEHHDNCAGAQLQSFAHYLPRLDLLSPMELLRELMTELCEAEDHVDNKGASDQNQKLPWQVQASGLLDDSKFHYVAEALASHAKDEKERKRDRAPGAGAGGGVGAGVAAAAAAPQNNVHGGANEGGGRGQRYTYWHGDGDCRTWRHSEHPRQKLGDWVFDQNISEALVDEDDMKAELVRQEVIAVEDDPAHGGFYWRPRSTRFAQGGGSAVQHGEAGDAEDQVDDGGGDGGESDGSEGRYLNEEGESEYDYEGYVDLLTVDLPAEDTSFGQDERLKDVRKQVLILQRIVKHCGVEEPTWAQLTTFVDFLEKQLRLCDQSSFTGAAAADVDGGLAGFRPFVVRFMVQMSRDFATPSLAQSDESMVASGSGGVLEQESNLRRKWEDSSHPYLFFNTDGHSLTFLGFSIDASTGHLLDPRKNNRVIESNIIPLRLFDALLAQNVDLKEDFSKHSKLQKIKKLLPVLSPPELHEYVADFRDGDDPDPSFELTADNCQKLLAMHVRFECGIPVCLFGETGIGKTRLVVYYARLCAALYPISVRRQRERMIELGIDVGGVEEVEEAVATNKNASSSGSSSSGMDQKKKIKNSNIKVVKVHGGTDFAEVERAVVDASRMARENFLDRNIKTTVLFFDECNTSYAALWLCQELMCDGTFGGKEVAAMQKFGLKVAVACNPYRRHSRELIERMAKSGLGYHHDAASSSAEGGAEQAEPEFSPSSNDIPIRHLVYRVHPLPPALRVHVYDFGSLSEESEASYIRLLVGRGLEKIVEEGRQRKLTATLQQRLAANDIVNAYGVGVGEEAAAGARQGQLQPAAAGQQQQANQKRQKKDKGKHNARGSQRDVPAGGDGEENVNVPAQEQNQDGTGWRTVWLCDIIDKKGLTKDFAVILRGCQKFMKSSKTEKSFVSLRDVERFLHVFEFFCCQLESKALGDILLQGQSGAQVRDATRGQVQLRTALICALGVCYYLALAPQSRSHFLKTLEKIGQSKVKLELLGAGTLTRRNFEDTLRWVMRTFMRELFLNSNQDTNKNIAQNTALTENVFLMTICAELRIPLFIVGKPGTSKSLARSLVDDAMKGRSSQSALFRSLKQCVQVSYQCSPLSTSEGILKVFRDCARRQRGKDLTDSVAVAVLDEVGLAEYSDTMALKTLHPLLETGCSPDGSFEDVEDYYKVGFYGISNWSLDPAKMNRGILVSRDEPDEAELSKTGAKILGVSEQHDEMLQKIVATYSEVYKKQGQPEIHGLRDFYCLLKMIGAEAAKRKWSVAEICVVVLSYCIKRNFTTCGMSTIDAVRLFHLNLFGVPDVGHEVTDALEAAKCFAQGAAGAAENERLLPDGSGDPTMKCSVKVLDMLLDNLQHRDPDGADPVRYPLIVARKGFASLDVLQESRILDCNGSKQYEILFGSSFANDHEYTNICRAINRVKLCLEKGVVCVLVNLGMIYESIYDALNQYYTCCGGNKYVDLGLGTNRFKCRVHSDARLVIVATKEEILRDFPVPLINRLEKHEVSMELALRTDAEKEAALQVRDWAISFGKLVAGVGSSDVDACGSAEEVEEVEVEKVERLLPEEGEVEVQANANDGALAVLAPASVESVFVERESHAFYNSFVGFDDETCFLLVAKAGTEKATNLFQRAQQLLLHTATPEAVLRYSAMIKNTGRDDVRLGVQVPAHPHQDLSSYFDAEARELVPILAARTDQEHEHDDGCSKGLKSTAVDFVQITTFARLLTQPDLNRIAEGMAVEPRSCSLLSLNEIQSESNLESAVKAFCKTPATRVSPAGAGANLSLSGGEDGHPLRRVLIVQSSDDDDYDGMETLGDNPGISRAAGGGSAVGIGVPAGGEANGIGAVRSHLHTGDDHALWAQRGYLMRALLRNTVWDACSRVSVGESAGRQEVRVKVLLGLLDDLERAAEQRGGAPELKREIVFHLFQQVAAALEHAAAQLDGEAAGAAASAQTRGSVVNWVDVVATNAIREGTFREACVRTFHEEVAKAFATVLAHVDRGCNLDLLNSDPAQWLRILKVLPAPAAALSSPQGGKDCFDFDASFACELPFFPHVRREVESCAIAQAGDADFAVAIQSSKLLRTIFCRREDDDEKNKKEDIADEPEKIAAPPGAQAVLASLKATLAETLYDLDQLPLVLLDGLLTHTQRVFRVCLLGRDHDQSQTHVKNDAQHGGNASSQQQDMLMGGGAATSAGPGVQLGASSSSRTQRAVGSSSTSKNDHGHGEQEADMIHISLQPTVCVARLPLEMGDRDAVLASMKLLVERDLPAFGAFFTSVRGYADRVLGLHHDRKNAAAAGASASSSGSDDNELGGGAVDVHHVDDVEMVDADGDGIVNEEQDAAAFVFDDVTQGAAALRTLCRSSLEPLRIYEALLATFVQMEVAPRIRREHSIDDNKSNCSKQ